MLGSETVQTTDSETTPTNPDLQSLVAGFLVLLTPANFLLGLLRFPLSARLSLRSQTLDPGWIDEDTGSWSRTFHSIP